MGGSGQLKKYTTEAVNNYFEPIRERRHQFEADLDYVKDVLHEAIVVQTKSPRKRLVKCKKPWAWCTRRKSAPCSRRK